MNNTLTILLVEDDIQACEQIKQAVTSYEDMKLIAVTNNSNEALELVHSYLPNVIILNLELHLGGGNGLLFLHELQKCSLDNPPYILVTTNNMSGVTLEQARQWGADFILTKYEKDYSAKYVIDNINLMRYAIFRKNTSIIPLPEQTPAEMELLLKKRIQRELDLIGINPKATGYKYLVDAILLSMQGTDIHISRTLAPKYGKSEQSIDRAMQNAIKQAWTASDIDDLLKYYTARINVNKGAPTLMEFICFYTKKLRLELQEDQEKRRTM